MSVREVVVVSPFHQSQKETEAENDAYKNKLWAIHRYATELQTLCSFWIVPS